MSSSESQFDFPSSINYFRYLSISRSQIQPYVDDILGRIQDLLVDDQVI